MDFLYQQIQINQVVIAGEGGTGLIRRIAETGGIQRQNLPQTLSSFFKKAYEIVCFLAKSTYTVFTWQT